MNSRMPGTVSASAMLSPRHAVVASVVQLLTSFIHLAASMSSLVSQAPACDSSSTTSPSRPLVAGWKLPTANQERAGGEWRSTIPGVNRPDEISITHPSVRSGPTTSATVSAVIPFWTATSRPSLLRQGSMSWLDHLAS